MAALLQFLSLTLLFTIFPHHTLSQNDPPSPSPLPTTSAPSPPPATADPSSSPSPASVYSPPAPPPSDLTPNSPSPAPSPGEDDFLSERKKSPAPAPAVTGELNRESAGDFEANYDDSSSSDGMTGGKKAGVAVGVIAGACVIGVGVLVYKKRQQNILRSQYGTAARRDFL